MGRTWNWVAAAALAAGLTGATVGPAGAETALDRLAAAWSNTRDYSVTILAHEVLGANSEDRVLHYFFRKPGQARLDVMSADRRVATVVWTGGEDLVAYRAGLSFLKIHGSVDDHRFTSLRGNGVRTPVLGNIVACLEQYRDDLQEHSGPAIDGEPTEEIVLDRERVACPGDSAADRDITRDVIDVSQSGTIVARKRYERAQLVEAWNMTDYRVNTGLDDGIFR